MGLRFDLPSFSLSLSLLSSSPLPHSLVFFFGPSAPLCAPFSPSLPTAWPIVALSPLFSVCVGFWNPVGPEEKFDSGYVELNRDVGRWKRGDTEEG